MVGIAQLVESRIVIPVVVGSSPISHPTILGVDHNLHWMKKRSLVLRFFISTHPIPSQTKKAAEAAFQTVDQGPRFRGLCHIYQSETHLPINLLCHFSFIESKGSNPIFSIIAWQPL